MSGRVLVVEDDLETRAAVRALLEDEGYVCLEAIDGETALDSLRHDRPDVVLLDLGLPRMSGADVHRELRRDPRTRFVPVLFLTAQTDHQAKIALFDEGADDYIAKPYEADELLARVGAAVRRSSGLRAVNPLSGLPGNTTITEELEKRLARREHFALLYVDIDRFKEFNDHYGFARGDLMIAMLAELLVQTAGAACFVGHVGGDDFVVLSQAGDTEAVAERVTRRFDETVPALYDADDRRRGSIEARDRRGALRRIPFATLSIGIVNVPPGRFDGATAAARAAAEVKEVAKRLPGSAWAVDRRKS
ncbi:MAG TPA: response regulator [Candidatus Limnocylindria bacterium]|jgi:diguanylate cyclase (GGDEF)-like protein|nr:response regulator [Candidatus Limnocylindria bacterium]